MNYREKIRKAIECPQFGDLTYGEWGSLRLDQRKLIKRLLDELDRADDYIKNLYTKNIVLEEKNKELEFFIADIMTNEVDNMLEKEGEEDVK